MRELVVSEAPLPRLAALAKAVVEREGGVVREHTHQKTHFDHLRTAEDNWSRSGYVGTYQPFQAKHASVRIRVWASWPRRLFLGFVFLGLAEALVFLALSLAGASPSPNVWIMTAIATIAGIALSLLTYATSWSGSTDVEEALVRALGAEVREDPEIPGSLYTIGAWKEHRNEVVARAVEAAEPQAPAAESGERGGRLVQIFRSSEAKEDEASGEEEEETEEVEKRGLLSRLKRGKDAGEEEEGAAKEEAEDEGGLLSRFRRERSSEVEEEAPGEEAEKRGLFSRLKRDRGESDEEEGDAPEEEDASGEKGGLLSRFKRGKSETSDADDEEGEVRDESA